MTTNTKPIETLRDGALKATIWKTFGEKGNFFRVRLTRSWKDDAGKYHDSDSFVGTEILRASRLLAQAYDRAIALRRSDADNANAGSSQ